MSQKGEPRPDNVPPSKNYPPYSGPRGPGRRGDQFQKNYEMTEDEVRTLRECQTESFWYRAMPLAVGAGLLAQTLVSRGTLTTSSRLGSIPKVGFACLFGYMAGKISYVRTCKQKFLKLENSPIGEMLRKGGSLPRSQGGSFGLPGFQPPSTEPDPSDPTVARDRDSYSGFGQSDDYRANLDIDTSNVKTMDNQFDFELSNEAASELEAKRPEMTKTYEDLRQENRQKHSAQYSQGPPGHYHPRQSGQLPPHDDKVTKRSDQLPFVSKSRSGMTKNKYGDDME